MGTLPVDICYFVQQLKVGRTAPDCVHHYLSFADRDLDGFPHKPILHALKATPAGVRASSFAGVWDKGVNLASPGDLAGAMEKGKSVVYDPSTREYRLATRAHRTVLLGQYDL